MYCRTNGDVACNWVADFRNYKGSNMFSDGNCIYSYGYHFVIARRIVFPGGGHVFLFNSNRYSNTTARHQSLVRWALRGEGKVFDVPGASTNHQQNTFSYIEQIRDLVMKSGSARKYKMKYIEQAEQIRRELSDYVRLFKTKRKLTKTERLLVDKSLYQLPELIEQIRQAGKERRANEIRRARERKLREMKPVMDPIFFLGRVTGLKPRTRAFKVWLAITLNLRPTEENMYSDKVRHALEEVWVAQLKSA